MRRKMTAPWLFALIAWAACYDGSIEVRFTLPELPMGPEIEEFHIVVYAEATGSIGCDALSFDDIPLDVLETTRVFDGTSLPGEAIAVTGIPRRGKKLFFAEATIASGASVFAGCEEVGDIDGPTFVEIEPFIRTNLSYLGSLAARDGGPGGSFIAEVPVNVVRLDGLPLRNAPVVWRFRGATTKGLSETIGQAQTNDVGVATVVIADSDPDKAWGPIELDVRSRWAQSQAAPLTDFLEPRPLISQVSSDLSPSTIGRGSDIVEVGRLTESGPMSIVVLAAEPPDGGGREQTQAHIFDLIDQMLEPRPPVLVGDNGVLRGARTLGKIRTQGADKIIAVYVDDVGGGKWAELGTAVVKNSPYSGVPTKLAAAGGCNGTSENVLFAQVIGARASLELASAAGVRLSQNIDLGNLGEDPDLVEIGCVRDTLQLFRTVFVADVTGGSSGGFDAFIPVLGTVDGSGTGVDVGVFRSPVTTAWIGDFSEAADGALLFGEATDQGPATTRYFVQPLQNNPSNPDDDAVVADLQGIDLTPSIVLATAEGDINGDGQTDVISLVSAGIGTGGIKVRVHVSMSLAGSALRLRGTVSQEIESPSPRLRVVDLNGDGADDIVVGSTDFVRVFLMGGR